MTDEKEGAEEKRRIRRLTSEESASFKQKRQARQEGNQDEPEKPGAREQNRDDGQKRSADSDRQGNVRLNLSPRVMALAEEFAEKEKMPVEKYLQEILRFVIFARADREGLSQPSQKYTAEIVSENRRKTTSWRPESQGDGEASVSGATQSGGSTGSDRPRQGAGRSGRPGRGFGSGKPGGRGFGRGKPGRGKAGRGFGRGKPGRGGSGGGKTGRGSGGRKPGRGSSRSGSGDGGK